VALLKVLGVTRAGAAAALGIEYSLVGLVAGLVGTIGATLLSGAVLKAAFEVSFHPEPMLLAGTPLAVSLLAAAAGLSVSVRALRVRPLEVLRSE
jgi:predicted lysophospholipase L1 biosynthesis ABC-type transport system permease subunit